MNFRVSGMEDNDGLGAKPTKLPRRVERIEREGRRERDACYLRIFRKIKIHDKISTTFGCETLENRFCNFSSCSQTLLEIFIYLFYVKNPLFCQKLSLESFFR